MGLGFYVSVLGVTCRFFFGRPPFLPLRRLAALPRWVFGPVEKPPCSLQRPPRYSALFLQGVPWRVFAPQQLLCRIDSVWGWVWGIETSQSCK